MKDQVRTIHKGVPVTVFFFPNSSFIWPETPKSAARTQVVITEGNG
jgi:hypothetical protein